MLKKNKKNKIVYLNKMNKTKIKFTNSIIQNSEINLKSRQFLFFYKKEEKKFKKNCLMGISNKYIHKKSKLSRFALTKINKENLNQNFIKYN